MARLESKIKLGFYATPERVVDMISTYLCVSGKKGGGRVRAIDPCAGEGAALEMLCRSLEIGGSFGVEIHEERAREAAKVIGKLIRGDAFRVRAKADAFSFLFLNPPYDTDEGRRLEYKFLRWWNDFLCTQGILVLIVRQRGMVKHLAKFVAYWFRDIEVYTFPEEEYEAFGQIVLFGVRKKEAVADPDVQTFLESVPNRNDLPVLTDFAFPKYEIPSSPVNESDFYFRNLDLTPDEMVEEVWRNGLLQDVVDQLWPDKEEAQIRPAFPLRKGHIAILVAAGLTDGLLESNGSRMLVKGTVKKHQVRSSETHDDGTHIEKVLDVLKISVRALDLNTGEIYTVS